MTPETHSLSRQKCLSFQQMLSSHFLSDLFHPGLRRLMPWAYNSIGQVLCFGLHKEITSAYLTPRPSVGEDIFFL